MTLIEVMAVVAIIGIFVALGFPTMGAVLEDRHTGRGAEEVANLFRIARSRAAATGASHRISANASSTVNAVFELRTALVNVGGPTSSCISPLWTDTDSRVLQTVDMSKTGTGNLARRDIHVDPMSGVSSTLEFCFTPGGISWIRNAGGLWQRPTGSQVTGWTIYRQDSAGVLLGMQRLVRIMPSGLPSIEAK